jgi:dTDP-4-dehydrorhamnose 3,5-epimerase
VSRFLFLGTPLEGLTCVDRQRIGDSRGFLSRLFCGSEFAAIGWSRPIAQINHTLTARKGTVRGMHFQNPPHTEMKLVSCVRGEVFDVAIDLRSSSPTFLQWHGAVLSAENGRALLIPEGFAHGFQALSDDVELIYCHSQHYHPDAEGGVNPRDPAIAIQWPLPIAETSARDAAFAHLPREYKGISA